MFFKIFSYIVLPPYNTMDIIHLENIDLDVEPLAPLLSEEPSAPLLSVEPSAPLLSEEPSAPLLSEDELRQEILVLLTRYNQIRHSNPETDEALIDAICEKEELEGKIRTKLDLLNAIRAK